MYGIELWDEFQGSKGSLKSLKITYHKCMKWMLGLPRWAGNHDICDTFQSLTLTHRINYEIFKFMFRIMKSGSACIAPFKRFLFEKSEFFRNGIKIANEIYGITDLFENDIEAIYARLVYVQATEERSHYYRGAGTQIPP